MTKYMRDAVHNKEYNYHYFKELFLRTLELIPSYEVFRGRNFVFSTSLYDFIFVGFGLKIERLEGIGPELIEEKIKSVKNNKEILDLMGSAASSKTRVLKRIKKAIEVLED